jgi:hypothetical protein
MVPVGLGESGPPGVGGHSSSPIRSWDEPGTWQAGKPDTWRARNSEAWRAGNPGSWRDQHPGDERRWHRAPAAAACQLGEADRC